MNYSLTEHARDALEKRRIAREWLERTFAAPELVERDAIDPDLEHRLIVNVRVVPPRIVTAYFDRRRLNQ